MAQNQNEAREATNEQGVGPTEITEETVSSESELALSEHLARKEAEEGEKRS